MNISLYIARGCYYAATVGGSPYWSLDVGLPTDICPTWITSAQTQSQDVVAAIPCFNNVKVASIIGKNFGTISIKGKALLGQESKNAFEGAFISAMNTARSASKGGTITLSSKGGAYYRFLATAFGVDGFIDEERNILQFSISGLLVD